MIGQIVGGIVRAVLAAFGGNLAAQGWMTDSEVQTAIGALLALGTVVWSVWSKWRKRTAPGEEFNPNAEVRKAGKADTGTRLQRIGRSPNGQAFKRGDSERGGFVRPVYLAVVVLILGLVWVVSAAVGQTTWRASRYDGAAQDCGGMSYDAWMRFVPVVDGRPFLVRLWDSMTFSLKPKAGLDEDGHFHAGIAQASIKGGTDF